MESRFYQIWQRSKKALFIAVIVFLAALGLRSASQYGFVTISVENPSQQNSQQTSVTLLNQNTNTETVVQTTAQPTRRLVKKSSYEVRASENGNNAWQIIESAGWFRSRTVTIRLVTEKNRSFIADNPRGCMYMDQQLLSYACSQPGGGIFRHNQTNGSTPPGVSELFSDTDLQPVAVVGTSSGAVALFKATPEIEETGAGSYSFAKLKPGSFDIDGEQTFLDELDASKNYQAVSYDGGILLYSEDYSDILYYPTIDSTAQSINLPKIDGSLAATSLNASGTSIVLSYQSVSKKEDNSLSKQAKDTRGATVVISKTKVVGTYYHETAWKSTTLCGTNTLCAMEPAGDKQRLTVLSINDSTLVPTYSISNVSQIIGLANRVLVVTRWGVLELNTENKSVTVDYSFNDYSYCGIGESRDPDQYVLCVADKSGPHALLVDTSAAFTDRIDVWATQLRASKDINSVIIDRKNMYIVLEYGDGVTRAGEDDFIDDDARIAAARQGAETVINSLKLRSLGYNIEILL